MFSSHRKKKHSMSLEEMDELNHKTSRHAAVSVCLLLMILSTTLVISLTSTTTQPSAMIYPSMRFSIAAAAVMTGPLNDTAGSADGSVEASEIPIYVVNLPYRHERWMETRRHLSQSKVLSEQKIQRHTAIVGKDQNINELWKTKRLSSHAYRSILSPRTVTGIFMTDGGLGCLLSHIELWKKAIELDHPILVFEDDVQLSPEFDQLFPELLRQLPDDFGLLYLADMVNNRKTRAAAKPFTSLLHRLDGEHWGTYAYMISPEAAQILYHGAFPIRFQVDSYIIGKSRQFQLPVYRSNSNLVTTDNSESRKSDVQLHHVEHKASIQPQLLLLQDISDFSTYDEKDRVFGEAYSVEIFDAIRLYQEQGAEIEEITNSALKLFRLRVALLYEYGGIFISNSFLPKHPIETILSTAAGVIAFQTDGTFPFLAMSAGHPIGLQLLRFIDDLNDPDPQQKILQFLDSDAISNIILVPSQVLRDRGY